MKMTEMIREFWDREWTCEEKVLLTLVAFLGGIVAGFLFAPFKSIACGNNNGNEFWLEEDEEEEEE